jgi:hypothetical protein
VEVAGTIWFASGLSGGISEATVTVAETALTATSELLGQDRGPRLPPAIAQALVLQAMQSSVITIPENAPIQQNELARGPRRFWTAPQLASATNKVKSAFYH